MHNMVLKVKHQLVPVFREGYVTVFSLLYIPTSDTQEPAAVRVPTTLSLKFLGK